MDGLIGVIRREGNGLGRGWASSKQLRGRGKQNKEVPGSVKPLAPVHIRHGQVDALPHGNVDQEATMCLHNGAQPGLNVNLDLVEFLERWTNALDGLVDKVGGIEEVGQRNDDGRLALVEEAFVWLGRVGRVKQHLSGIG
jgi:hypothetical protein